MKMVEKYVKFKKIERKSIRMDKMTGNTFKFMKITGKILRIEKGGERLKFTKLEGET